MDNLFHESNFNLSFIKMSNLSSRRISQLFDMERYASRSSVGSLRGYGYCGFLTPEQLDDPNFHLMARLKHLGLYLQGMLMETG